MAADFSQFRLQRPETADLPWCPLIPDSPRRAAPALTGRPVPGQTCRNGSAALRGDPRLSWTDRLHYLAANLKKQLRDRTGRASLEGNQPYWAARGAQADVNSGQLWMNTRRRQHGAGMDGQEGSVRNQHTQRISRLCPDGRSRHVQAFSGKCLLHNVNEESGRRWQHPWLIHEVGKAHAAPPAPLVALAADNRE